MTTWRVEQGDCLELLKALPDGSVDAVVTDPPYGINAVKGGKCFGTSNACSTGTYRAIAGDSAPFDPSPFVSLAPIVCLFGANHFADKLPSRARWLVWDKRDGCNPNPMADCELAWTSDTRPARLFHHRWMGMIKASECGRKRVHPTQKPVELMKWVLDTFEIPEGATVLDPFCGSGTTGVACVQTGRNFIGFEIDSGYCKIARDRIAKAEAEIELVAT